MRHAWALSERFTSRRARLLLAVAAMAGYILIYFGLAYGSPAGPAATALSGVSVAIAGWLLGLWLGLAAGLATLPLNLGLLEVVGLDLSDALGQLGNGAACATNVAIGWG